MGANLSEANLAGADLQKAQLTNTNLYRANLTSAWLASAQLQDANLSQANLFKSTLNSANLQDADLSQANLMAASPIKANLQDVDLKDADLTRLFFSKPLSAKLHSSKSSLTSLPDYTMHSRPGSNGSAKAPFSTSYQLA